MSVFVYEFYENYHKDNPRTCWFCDNNTNQFFTEEEQYFKGICIECLEKASKNSKCESNKHENENDENIKHNVSQDEVKSDKSSKDDEASQLTVFCETFARTTICTETCKTKRYVTENVQSSQQAPRENIPENKNQPSHSRDVGETTSSEQETLTSHDNKNNTSKYYNNSSFPLIAK